MSVWLAKHGRITGKKAHTIYCVLEINLNAMNESSYVTSPSILSMFRDWFLQAKISIKPTKHQYTLTQRLWMKGFLVFFFYFQTSFTFIATFVWQCVGVSYNFPLRHSFIVQNKSAIRDFQSKFLHLMNLLL